MYWKKYVIEHYLGAEFIDYQIQKSKIQEKIYHDLTSGDQSKILGASKVLISLDNLHFTSEQVREITRKCTNLTSSTSISIRDYRTDVEAAVMVILNFHDGGECKCAVYPKWIQFLPEREIEMGFLTLAQEPTVHVEKYQTEYRVNCQVCHTHWIVCRNDGYHYPTYEWEKI